MDVMPSGPPSDDLQAMIHQVRSDLTVVGEAPFMRREPYSLVLVALADTLSVFGRSITRWERAVADVIAARDPLPEADRIALKAELAEAVGTGAYNGMRKEAQRMVRTLDRHLSVQIGLTVGGAYILGVLSLVAMLFALQLGPFSREAKNQAAWSALIENNPDPRPSIASAEIRTDQTGRRYYAGLSLWLDPSRPPK
jgi:hypothetical protein